MLSAKEVAALAAKALDAKMGEDIRLIGITDISTLADFFLICTATSSTHVKTLCDAVEEAMDEAGAPPGRGGGGGGGSRCSPARAIAAARGCSWTSAALSCMSLRLRPESSMTSNASGRTDIR